MHAARSHDEMQAGRKQDRDQDVNAEHQRVRLRTGKQRQAEQDQQQHHAGDNERARSRADRRLDRPAAAGGCLRSSEQALRPGDQHNRHHQKLGDQREFGEIDGITRDADKPDADAQRLDLGHQYGRDVGADDRAHAADHHDDESIGDHRQVHAEIGRLARDLQRAAEAGEQRAEREYGGEQHRLIDAERAQHLAVFGGGAHQPAEARAREYEMQRDQHQRRDRDQENVVARHAPPENVDGAAQTGRPRAEQILGSPKPQRRVVDDQKQRESGEQLKQFRRRINASQQQHFDQRADDTDRDRADDDPAPEAQRAVEPGRQCNGDIGAKHIERAVRQIDDAGDAEDERKAGCDQEQTGRRRQTVDRLKGQAFPVHGSCRFFSGA